MPRSSVLLTATPLDADVIAAAAGRVWASLRSTSESADHTFALRSVDGGAVLQVLVAGAPALSLLRPRMMPTIDEVSRLLPGITAPEPTSWWTDAYTPWQPQGAIGLAILDAAAAASAGRAVHQGLESTWRATAR